MRKAKLLSVVVPFHNEEEVARDFLAALEQTCRPLSDLVEIITVDDGSKDDTLAVLHAVAKELDCIKILSFNRNFGKEAALHAGLRHASGDAVITIDGDGQHPVEDIPKMVKLWGAGSDVVVGCKLDRGEESFLSRFFAASFYWVFQTMSGIDMKNVSDFMVLDRRVVEQYCTFPERRRFFRGMIMWMGYSTSRVNVRITPRIGGRTSWRRSRLFRLGTSAITSFSSGLLHLISVLSILYAFGALIVGGITLFHKITGNAVTGFSTVNILILTTGALIMFGLGQIGFYLEQIFEELKGRPTYIVRSHENNAERGEDAS